MTLVLSLLTKDYLLQVSDRRLTDLTTGRIVDDNRNKGTVYGGLMAFSYSGLATIDGQPTDEWLAATICPLWSIADIMQAIVDRATGSFHGISLPPSAKRHAFVAVGWVQIEDNGPLVPSFATISNALDDECRWLAAASDTFEIAGMTPLTDARYYWYFCPPVGARLSEERTRRLARLVRQARKHHVSPFGLADLLVREVREVAKAETTVGSKLLVVYLPRSAALARRVSFMTPVDGNRPDPGKPCCYFLDDVEGKFSWVLPNLAFGGQMQTGSVFEQTDDGWSLTTRVFGSSTTRSSTGFLVDDGTAEHVFEFDPTAQPGSAKPPG